MKKFFLFLFGIFLLFFVGCRQSPETSTKATEIITQLNVPAVPNADFSDRSFDIDMSAMKTQLAYLQITNMMIDPEQYTGKTVKMTGTFAHTYDNNLQCDFFVCYIPDETACCTQSLEFVINGDYSYPDDYPPDESTITVAGTFEKYIRDGYDLFRLNNAEISY